MPRKRNRRDEDPTVAGTIADLVKEIRDGRVSEVVGTLEGMTEYRRGAVLSNGALLGEAVKQRQCQLVERLADLGAQPQRYAFDDVTVLDVAVRNDDGRTVEVLMSRGLTGAYEEPLFDCLVGHHDDAMSAVLCWGGAREPFSWHSFSRNRDLSLSSLELLLQRDFAGRRFLVTCWCDLHDEEVEDALGLFVALGVDISRTMCFGGATALGACMARSDTRRVRLLLGAGADPCVSNVKGEVPLDFVILDCPENWDPLLKDLLFAGAVAHPLLVLLGRRLVTDAEALSWLMQAGSCFGDLSVEPDRTHWCLFDSCRGDVLRLLWHVIGPLIFRLRDLSGGTVLHHLSVACVTSFVEFDFAGNAFYPWSVHGTGTVAEDLVFLLERSADPNVTTPSGIPAIFSAVCYDVPTPITIQKCAMFVDDLLSFGASLATPVGQRRGPLMANWKCGGQLLPMLLDRGADIRDLEDDDHARFLESLSEHCRTVGPANLRHFVDHGSDLSVDPRLKTSLHPHLASVARHWSPFTTDTETIFIPPFVPDYDDYVRLGGGL